MSKSKLGYGLKAKAIREILASHPDRKNRELVEILNSKGIVCTAQDVAIYRAKNKKQGKDTSVLTVDQLLVIKGLIQESGGMKAVQSKLAELDEIASAAGGLSKLQTGLDLLTKMNES